MDFLCLCVYGRQNLPRDDCGWSCHAQAVKAAEQGHLAAAAVHIYLAQFGIFIADYAGVRVGIDGDLYKGNQLGILYDYFRDDLLLHYLVSEVHLHHADHHIVHLHHPPEQFRQQPEPA